MNERNIRRRPDRRHLGLGQLADDPQVIKLQRLGLLQQILAFRTVADQQEPDPRIVLQPVRRLQHRVQRVRHPVRANIRSDDAAFHAITALDLVAVTAALEQAQVNAVLDDDTTRSARPPFWAMWSTNESVTETM